MLESLKLWSTLGVLLFTFIFATGSWISKWIHPKSDGSDPDHKFNFRPKYKWNSKRAIEMLGAFGILIFSGTQFFVTERIDKANDTKIKYLNDVRDLTFQNDLQKNTERIVSDLSAISAKAYKNQGYKYDSLLKEFVKLNDFVSAQNPLVDPFFLVENIMLNSETDSTNEFSVVMECKETAANLINWEILVQVLYSDGSVDTDVKTNLLTGPVKFGVNMSMSKDFGWKHTKTNPTGMYLASKVKFSPTTNNKRLLSKQLVFYDFKTKKTYTEAHPSDLIFFKQHKF